MNRKLVIIDLDGATFDVIKPLVEKGLLPNFKKLLDGGTHGLLQSTVPAITPCAYSSFITGRLPRNTGIFDFVFKVRDRKNLNTVNSTVLDGVPFWRIMNHYGRKVGIINLPMTYPVSPVDGFMIGCGLTASNADQKDFHYPKDIFERNSLDRSSYILKPEWKTMRYRSPEEYNRDVLRMFETRKELTLKLMKNEQWDFFMVHVHAIDWLQHSFWNDGEKIADIHMRVDALIGTVLDNIDEGTDLMIMSDHGFGPTHRTMSLSRWLIKEGFLKTRPISFGDFYSRLLLKVFGGEKKAGYRLLNGLYRAFPGPLNRLIDRIFTAAYGAVPSLHSLYSVDYMNRIDWEKTDAFTYGQIGAIYINGGHDHAEYERVRDEITRRLYKLADENGEKIVEKVYTKEEIYSGAHEDTAPDLLIYPSRVMYFHPDLDLKGVLSPPVHWRVGNHAKNGIFIAYGRNYRAGEFIGPIDITDVTPTMLYSMGLPSLNTMDGTAAERCFTSEYLAAGTPRRIDEGIFRQEGAVEVDDDSDIIREQLKGLGYI